MPVLSKAQSKTKMYYISDLPAERLVTYKTAINYTGIDYFCQSSKKQGQIQDSQNVMVKIHSTATSTKKQYRVTT